MNDETLGGAPTHAYTCERVRLCIELSIHSFIHLPTWHLPTYPSILMSNTLALLLSRGPNYCKRPRNTCSEGSRDPVVAGYPLPLLPCNNGAARSDVISHDD